MYVILVWCWLRGYAVVKTFPSPWYMLVGKKVATRLRGYVAVKPHLLKLDQKFTCMGDMLDLTAELHEMSNFYTNTAC